MLYNVDELHPGYRLKLHFQYSRFKTRNLFLHKTFSPRLVKPWIAPPGFSIELMDGGQWRTGGASISQSVEGDGLLGTLRLVRCFTDVQSAIRVKFFSIGPSFTDRDDYLATDLNIMIIDN